MWYNIVENRKEEGGGKMEKSMYSVILRDDLVDELDRVAFRNGVSRSVMLNKILAEYLDVETPEAQIEKALERAGQIISAVNGLRFTNNASLAMAQVQSALCYRYNPTLRYQIELFPAGDLGQLKISLRSQNKELFKIIESFYALFISLEKKHVGERQYYYEDGRFIRVLVRPENVSAEEAGEAVSDYIRMFDSCLKTYFSNLSGNPERATETEYLQNIKKKKVIL